MLPFHCARRCWPARLRWSLRARLASTWTAPQAAASARAAQSSAAASAWSLAARPGGTGRPSRIK
eukprot:4030763-Alexandrium_andersonii.AAC.1